MIEHVEMQELRIEEMNEYMTNCLLTEKNINLNNIDTVNNCKQHFKKVSEVRQANLQRASENIQKHISELHQLNIERTQKVSIFILQVIGGFDSVLFCSDIFNC